MHETLKDVTRKIGVKTAGQRVAGLGEVAWRKTSKESFFSAKVEREQTFKRRSELRESFWMVDMNQALRKCEGRQVEVDPSEVLDV